MKFWGYDNFCKEVGIKRELTATYKLQQNGVAKRKNRSIMEATRSMIHDQDIPMHIWEEVARIAVYVQNIISQGALGNKTP